MIDSVETQFRARAREFIDELGRGEWSAAARYLDGEMLLVLDAAGLRHAWKDVESASGSYTGRGEPMTRREGNLVVTETTISFANQDLCARVTGNDQGSVVGFYIVAASRA